MKHSHYHKPIPPQATHIDVYRVLAMFGVTDPCIQHAVKKLLVAGGRGHKDAARDVQEAIDSLVRWQDMRKEEVAPGAISGGSPAVTAEQLRPLFRRSGTPSGVFVGMPEPTLRPPTPGYHPLFKTADDEKREREQLKADLEKVRGRSAFFAAFAGEPPTARDPAANPQQPFEDKGETRPMSALAERARPVIDRPQHPLRRASDWPELND
ncbi:MAG: hypothetical protein HY856_13535 [Burkholderiales bacterium]|nr:hypothetical protein [Burkholderiales bacterium]